jgi:flavorubredoxin
MSLEDQLEEMTEAINSVDIQPIVEAIENIDFSEIATEINELRSGVLGLSKLEFIAAMAMHGILSKQGTTFGLPSEIANCSVDLAKELLREVNDSQAD